MPLEKTRGKSSFLQREVCEGPATLCPGISDTREAKTQPILHSGEGGSRLVF